MWRFYAYAALLIGVAVILLSIRLVRVNSPYLSVLVLLVSLVGIYLVGHIVTLVLPLLYFD